MITTGDTIRTASRLHNTARRDRNLNRDSAYAAGTDTHNDARTVKPTIATELWRYRTIGVVLHTVAYPAAVGWDGMSSGGYAYASRRVRSDSESVHRSGSAKNAVVAA